MNCASSCRNQESSVITEKEKLETSVIHSRATGSTPLYIKHPNCCEVQKLPLTVTLRHSPHQMFAFMNAMCLSLAVCFLMFHKLILQQYQTIDI